MNNKRINIGSTVVVKKQIMAYENGREYALELQIKGTVDYIDEKDIEVVLDSSTPIYTTTLPIEGDELETDSKQLD